MTKPLQRIAVDPERAREGAWYWTVPAIRHLREHGLDLTAPVTIVVGENGSGKSTFIEALAFAWTGNLPAAVHHWGPLPSDEDTDLHRAIRLTGERPPPNGGCFLRAEAMHAHFGRIDSGEELRAFDGIPLNARSHGEAFLAFLESRRYERGLYLLDEPEAALSFRSCLRLIALLADAVAAGSQVVMATHSPVLAAFPRSVLLELSDNGIEVQDYDGLDLVRDWREFLAAPERWTRHLVD
ncbi:MAG TPA: AAA family ATPase [Mycobacteriales bacterium]|nr:AAA family ATPase [Mycobacteriales bacterium]